MHPSEQGLVPLPLLFLAWYASSVVCTTLSKVLVHDAFPSAYWLSLAQFIVASGVGSVAVRIANGAPPAALPAGPAGKHVRRDVWALSIIFSFGMLALNKGYENMHVSLVETLRATEPVVSACLAAALMPAEAPNLAQVSALLPIVLGACLSSFGSADFTILGLMWVVASNFCFCLRTIQYKQVRRRHQLDEWTLFYHICRMGAVCQLIYALVGDAAGLRVLLSGDIWSLPVVALTLANGFLYYTYLQCSWVILMRVAVVTHAVGNSMRRPVVLVCNVIYFGNHVNAVNALGICMAFAGVLVYSQLKATDGSRKA
eukprot:CAMPEP_0171060680 /NCGR_PEP_ID=MMETSP0766_2-20121228/3980_1 /TAXON_ID=439317 /ORGANISM="Gambierdiscus australes, Strain CAWD 149" /LENGTH=314 /DNA_ID=CAMNT_0011516283 /DNA_START=71 /DNA_END=1015 /DNA_ORIENTATION=-